MSARKPIVAGNWKMNKNIKEARELIQGILPEVQQIDAVEVMLLDLKQDALDKLTGFYNIFIHFPGTSDNE